MPQTFKLSANVALILAIEHNLSSGDVMFGSPLYPAILEPILGADAGAWRGGMIQYRGIPNFRAVSWKVKLPFATSWWRSLGLLANTFAIESFIDELAVRAEKDPVQFRLDHIQDCEGSIIMRLSAALYEKMSVRDGALYPTIYGPYKMALMKHAPREIDVVILENADKPGAVGEPPMGPIGAAIANAVFRLAGQRLRSMPLELAYAGSEQF